MLETKELKQIFIVLVSIVLTLGLSISLQSVLADWAPPTANPPENNLLPPIYNEGVIDIPVINKPLTINDNFHVGTNDLVVDHTTGNVGIGDTSPDAKLDVNGTIRATTLCDEGGANCKDISDGWTNGATVTRVVNNTSSCNGWCTVSATCPSGYVLVGCSGRYGGACYAGSFGLSYECAYIGSVPLGNMCTAHAYEGASVNHTLYVYALCLRQ